MSDSAIEFRVLKQALPHTGMSCLSMMRNERYFVPHFLKHYRGLGVGRFVIYDDGSRDGTREYLMSQDDCMVITAAHEFDEEMADGRLFHQHVRTEIAERYCPGEWYLFVDADEFLFMPSRYASLADVTGDLESRGQLCALAAMVDFYPKTLAERNYSADLGPLERRKWWFDRQAAFTRNPYTDVIEIRANGVRSRLLQTLADNHPEIVKSIFPKGKTFPKLWKVPLVKAGEGILSRDGHSLTAKPPVEVQLALAHFRFYPDLDRRIAEALERKNHSRASQGYRFLAAAVEHLGSEKLVSAESVKFAGASSLEEAGLMFAHAPAVRPAPARTSEIFGAPLVYERLADIDANGEFERMIFGEYELARKAGVPAGKAWQTSLADRRFQSAPMRSIVEAAARAAASKTAARGRRAECRLDWTVAAVAVVLPPGGAAVRVTTKGLWAAVHHLRVDPGTGGQVALRDEREEGISPLFRDWRLGDPAAPAEPSVSPAPGLLLLFPSWCALSLSAWHGKGWRISVVLELTPDP